MTPSEFLECLGRSHLLGEAELSEIRTAAVAAGDAETLADQLIKKGKLTQFQAQSLLRGESKGLVLGNYTVLGKIGEGGMGQVFKARHRRMERVVALKTVSGSVVAIPGAVERFQREVKAAAQLIHPHIVTAFDADEADGIHFLVMEYVEGQDLSMVVAHKGPLPYQAAVGYALQAARGLEHAHRAGIIHRDIKPSNLLLDRSGVVRILDMGLARFESGDLAGDGLSKPEYLLGTYDYMPPEQARGSKFTDHRGDIYALGCTLHLLLTGKVPYHGEDGLERLLAHRNQPIPSLCAANPKIPAALDQVFHKMLAKKSVNRYQSMTHVAADLEAVLAGREPVVDWGDDQVVLSNIDMGSPSGQDAGPDAATNVISLPGGLFGPRVKSQDGTRVADDAPASPLKTRVKTPVRLEGPAVKADESGISLAPYKAPIQDSQASPASAFAGGRNRNLLAGIVAGVILLFAAWMWGWGPGDGGPKVSAIVPPDKSSGESPAMIPAKIPPDKTSVPPDKATVPPDKSNNPPDKVTDPPDKHGSITPKPAQLPVKVFILAGQSNMSGRAAIRTLDWMGEDPKHRWMLEKIKNPDGTWVVRDDVWVYCRRDNNQLKTGALTVGFGYNDGEIGPELLFGHLLGDHYENQVLLIKFTQGGLSLAIEGRPPSSGGNTGPYYRQMIWTISEVLSKLSTHFPKYAGQGYELAGFCWFQDWNDLNPPDRLAEYEFNLVNFVKDVRRELAMPKLPFVIGELGVDGESAAPNIITMRKIQASVASRTEFAGTIALAKTVEFWDTRAADLLKKGWVNRNWITPEIQQEFEKMASHEGYHYLGSGTILSRVGVGFAEEMKKLEPR